MTRFRFPLEPLLGVRRSREEAQQRVLAALERRRRDLEDVLRRHQEHLARGKDGLRKAVSGKVDLTTMRAQAQATLSVMRRANQIVLQLAGLHQQIERARRDLIERTRDRRSVELLRERRFEEWRADLEKAEALVLDDLAAQAAQRKGATS